MARKHIGKRKKGGRKVVEKRPPAHKARPEIPPPRPSPSEVRMTMGEEGAASSAMEPPRGVVAPCRGFGSNISTDISPIAD